jgi:hypothetical protein
LSDKNKSTQLITYGRVKIGDKTMNRNIFILSVMAFFTFTAIAFSAITQTKTDKSKDNCGCSVEIPKSVKTANNTAKPWWYKRNRQAGTATGSGSTVFAVGLRRA